jgi:hypothetical protein
VPEKLTPLEVRHAAALQLVAAGELDGVLALSLVVRPPRSRLEDQQVPVTRQVYSQELKAEIRQRYAAGESMPYLAASTGVPYAILKAWLSKAGRERDL